MSDINKLSRAKELFDKMGGDPQTVFAVLRVAKEVDFDPQKVMALLELAKFLEQNS